MQKKKEKKNGKNEEKIEIARALLKEKIAVETILKVTGLTKEEIEKLKNI